jgi:hypothetical protein
MNQLKKVIAYINLTHLLGGALGFNAIAGSPIAMQLAFRAKEVI